MPRVTRVKPTFPNVPLELLHAAHGDLEQIPELQDRTGHRYGIRHPHQRAFLAAYSQLPNITRAAEVAGISRAQVYVWKHNDPTFDAAMEEAHTQAVERLEHSAFLDALGGEVATRIFLLKSHRPEVYDRERHVRVTGQLGHDLDTGPRDEADLSRLSAPELIVYRALRRKALERELDELDEQALAVIARAANGGDDDGERRALRRGDYKQQRAAS